MPSQSENTNKYTIIFINSIQNFAAEAARFLNLDPGNPWNSNLRVIFLENGSWDIIEQFAGQWFHIALYTLYNSG